MIYQRVASLIPIARGLASSLSNAVTRILQDNHGATATVVAIALPSLIGFGALGAETGVWYTIKLRNQSAADAAAISAAYEVIAGKTDIAGELTRAASEAATQNGYTGTTPAVVHPYSDGVVSGAVAVTLQQTERTLLSAMFLPHVTITTTAVAVIEILDNACILALGTSGTDVEVVSQLDMRDCAAAADSTSTSAIDLHSSSSSIAAATLVTRGEVSLQGNPIDPAAPPPEFTLGSRPMIGAPSISDPYAGTLTHAFLTSGILGSPVVHKGSWNGTATITPALYDKGMSFEAGAVVALAPGVYYVTNHDFSVDSGAIVTCTTCNGPNGVTIILTTTAATVGSVRISPGAKVILQAPNSGKFSGLVFIQDSNGLPPGTTYTSRSSTLGLTSGATLNGLVYFPNSAMTFQGNPSATGPKCLLLVVSSVTFNGRSSLAASGCASARLTRLPAIYTVAVAE